MHPLTLLVLLIAAADAAPPRKGKVFGPCIGMDCLHGVLMHGDDKRGHDHGVEDAEKHREELERQNANQLAGKPGQMNQEEFMHGVLMHGDDKVGAAHSHEKAPTVEKQPVQNGPMSQEDLMHGVLMHGDSNPDHRHRHSKADDAALKASEAGSADGRVPSVELRPAGYADDDGFVSRWWTTVKQLVIGGGGGNEPKSRPASRADYNLMQDLAAVGSTKTVEELEKATGHNHRDTDKVHRERNRKEHTKTLHIEH